MKPLDDYKVNKKTKYKLKKEYAFIIILSVVAILIFISGSSIFSSAKGKNATVSSYETALESRVESLLREIEGVGKVKVFINAKVIETDKLSANQNTLKSLEESAFFANDKQDLNELNVKVIGVIVVCQGADKLNVKVTVTEVITTALSVSADSIRIIKMK